MAQAAPLRRLGRFQDRNPAAPGPRGCSVGEVASPNEELLLLGTEGHHEVTTTG